MQPDIDSAHVSTFPTEILQAIFSVDQDAVPYALQPKPQYPQLRLAHVCRTWRYAALDLPPLWNRLRVRLQPSARAVSANGHTTWSWQHSLDMFLIYAKNSPLMVDITWSGGAEVASEVCKISSVLFQTSPRWKAASLTFQAEIDWSFLDPLYGNLPLLEDLSFDVDGCAAWELGESFVMKTCNAFSVVPSLRSVGLQCYNGGFPRIEIPWHQITRFSTRLSTGRGAADILDFIWDVVVSLGSSGRLKELSLWDPCGTCTRPPSPIVIPSLTHFSFEEGRYLADSLTLPALRELTVRDDIVRSSGRNFLVVDILRKLIYRSECTITVLNIDDYTPSTARRLADLATHFRALTHFSMRASHHFNQTEDHIFISILVLLTPAPSSVDADQRNVNFPLLEHLTLSWDQSLPNTNDAPVTPACADALCDMLERRYPWRSTPPRVFTHAVILPHPGTLPFPSTWIPQFKRSAGWARITRAYQGQLDISIRVAMNCSGFRYKADFEMWLGRTDGGRSPNV